LYVGPSADSDFKKILTAKNNVVVYSWSPDGRQISYGVCYFDEEQVQLWVVDADGGNAERLFAEREDLQYIPSAEWTPDGNWLVFRNGVPGDLWAVRRHKGLLDRRPQEPVPLTDSLEHFTGFTLSPDGKMIYAIFNPRRTELVRYRDEINSWVPYTFPINPSSAYLDFSTDAQWVTYVQIPEFTLWRIRVDGTQRRQLTDRGMYVRSPQWSPDGRTIAFCGGPNPWGLDYRVYVVSREGGPLQRVIREEYPQQNGDWSPEGKLLVSSGRGPVRPGEKSPSQSNPLRLVDVWTGTFEELPDSEGKRESAWSPDGRYVASCQAGSGELAVFDTEHENWKPLEGCRGGRLTWSADSSYLFFCGSDRRLYRVHTENRGMEEVALFDDLGPHPFPSDQWWFGFGPEGILLTIRWLEREEIYALDFEAH
jgi:Tol biopolymer transport system component